VFHEFGHGLHHMLTRVAYPSIAGINGVAWTRSSCPASSMENFVWRAEVLPLISRTSIREPLPVRHACSLLGLRAHSTRRSTPLAARSNIARIFECTRTRCQSWRECRRDPRRRAAARGHRARRTLQSHARKALPHIFPAATRAGYYSYKWAEVLAADAFEAFEEAGVFDAKTAARFRESIPRPRRQHR